MLRIIIGFILVVYSILGIIGSLSGAVDNKLGGAIVHLIVFGLPGVLLIIYGRKARKKRKIISESISNETENPNEAVGQVVDQKISHIDGSSGNSREKSDYDIELEKLKTANEAPVILAFKACSPASLLSIMLRVFGVGMVTGNVNVGALSVKQSRNNLGRYINSPSECCLCGINEGTMIYSSEMKYHNSLGMLLGGPILGEQTLRFYSVYCKSCESETKNMNGIRVIGYKKSEDKKNYLVRLAFKNPSVADKFEKLNLNILNREESLTHETILKNSIQNTVKVNLLWKGSWGLNGMPLDIQVDKTLIDKLHASTFRKGFNISFKVSPGKHRLFVFNTQTEINVMDNFEYFIDLKYNRTWGKFKFNITEKSLDAN